MPFRHARPCSISRKTSPSLQPTKKNWTSRFPQLNPDSQVSKLLWYSTAIAGSIFVVLYVLQLKSMLLGGDNCTPLHILATATDKQTVNDDVRVTVVTRWSELELARSGSLWGFPEDRIRNAPRIKVSLASVGAANHQFYISTEAKAPDISTEPTSTGWIPAPLVADENATGQFHLNTKTIGESRILDLLGRRCINWGGDLKLLTSAMAVPATKVGSFWLVLVGFLSFYGAMKVAPEPPKTMSPASKSVSGRVDGLDHIRGCAILMVCMYHCLWATFGYDQLGWSGWFRNLDHDSTTFLALAPVTFGFGGVAVFFAISGFCIHLSYQRSSDKSWMKYLWRRLFRIYPPFLVALLFFAFCFPLTSVNFSTNGLQQFYSRVFLYFNLAQHSYWGINSSFWSVAVEMQLYLVYPFLLVAAQRIGWRPVLILAFLVEVGLQLPSSELRFLVPGLRFPFAMLRGPFGYVFSWLIGAKLADDFIAGRPLTFRRVPMAVWVVLLTMSLTFKPAAPFQFILFSLTTIGAIARFAEGKSLRLGVPDAVSNHVAWVGTISYSVYLLHQPFLNVAPKILVWLNNGEFVHPALKLLSCIAIYPLILWLSGLMYRFVELPSIAAGKWFVSRAAKKSGTKNPVETAAVSCL